MKSVRIEDTQCSAELFAVGDLVGIQAASMVGGFPTLIFEPDGYLFGDPLSGTATWNGTNFGNLGVNPGTYVRTWGTGANQNFTLIIGGAGVPDGGTTVSLLGCALLGLAAVRRKLSC